MCAFAARFEDFISLLAPIVIYAEIVIFADGTKDVGG